MLGAEVLIVRLLTSGFPLLFQSSDGSVQPPEVLPGAPSRLPAADGPAGPGTGVAAAGHLPPVSAALDDG